MSSFMIPLFFKNTPGSSTPLAADGVAYSNETNVAQSIPLVDQGAAAREGIPEDRVKAFINRANDSFPTPAAPAGPTTPTTVQPSRKTGLLLIGGVAAAGLVWFFVFRRKKP